MDFTLNTGFKIPLIGFGTYKVVGEQVLPTLDSAISAGYRLFDTAKVYNNEKEIGNGLEILLPKHNLSRNDIFLTTKLHPVSENCYEETIKRVDESLELLKTDYIDLYLIHYTKPNNCENDDPKNAEYRKLAYTALEECKKAGKIRSIGVSSYEINHLEELKSYSNEPRPSVNQVEYHPHFTRTALKKYCEENGIFFQAFSSLARHNDGLLLHPSVVSLAGKYNVEKTTLLLSWAVSQNVGVIPKSSNFDRMVENRKLVQLSGEDVEILAKLDKGQHYVRTTGWLVK